MLPYHIVRSHRQTIALQVTPSGNLIVRAPIHTRQETIERFIQKHNEWIKKTQTKINTSSQILQRTYDDGEEFLFLGEKRKLTLVDTTAIELTRDTLYFPKALRFRAKKELEIWYKKQALAYISQRVKYFSERMKVTYKSISIADTKSRWGSCTHDNKLQFNWRLIMTPYAVLDSVVVHELAHTLVKNHSASFWSHVLHVMPGYKVHRAWINHNSSKLIL